MFNLNAGNIDYHYKCDSSVPYVCNGFLAIYDTENQLQFIRISSIESIYFDSSDKCTYIGVIGCDATYDTLLTPKSVFDFIKDYLV